MLEDLLLKDWLEDDEDVMPICENCEHEVGKWGCCCQQRKEDIKNDCLKGEVNGHCPYFQEQEWIKNSGR